MQKCKRHVQGHKGRAELGFEPSSVLTSEPAFSLGSQGSLQKDALLLHYPKEFNHHQNVPSPFVRLQNNTMVIENHMKILFALENSFFGRQGKGVAGRQMYLLLRNCCWGTKSDIS